MTVMPSTINTEKKTLGTVILPGKNGLVSGKFACKLLDNLDYIIIA